MIPLQDSVSQHCYGVGFFWLWGGYWFFWWVQPWISAHEGHGGIVVKEPGMACTEIILFYPQNNAIEQDKMRTCGLLKGSLRASGLSENFNPSPDSVHCVCVCLCHTVAFSFTFMSPFLPPQFSHVLFFFWPSSTTAQSTSQMGICTKVQWTSNLSYCIGAHLEHNYSEAYILVVISALWSLCTQNGTAHTHQQEVPEWRLGGGHAQWPQNAEQLLAEWSILNADQLGIGMKWSILHRSTPDYNLLIFLQAPSCNFWIKLCCPLDVQTSIHFYWLVSIMLIFYLTCDT